MSVLDQQSSSGLHIGIQQVIVQPHGRFSDRRKGELNDESLCDEDREGRLEPGGLNVELRYSQRPGSPGSHMRNAPTDK